MRLSIVTLFLIIKFLAFSEYTNFRKGYIISLENDTISGLVDFRLDEENMCFVNFQAEGETNARQYFPGEITGYRLVDDGKFYVSKEIEIRDNKRQTVFVEYLVQGIKNLYYYKLNEQDFYLIEGAVGELIVLSKKPDEFENLRIIEDVKYKGMLKYVFKEYEQVHKQTDKAQFKRKDLIKLTKDYHNNVCEDGSTCIIFENDYSKKFITSDFSLFVGLQSHNLMFYTIYQNRQRDLFVNSVAPEIGAQFSFFSPRLNPSLGLFAEVSCSKIEGKLEDFVINSGIPDAYNVYEHRVFRINSTLGVKYLFKEKRLRPSIEIGLITGFMIDPENKLSIYDPQESMSIPQLEFENLFLADDKRVGLTGAFQLDYKLQNSNYIFAKIGYYNTLALTTFTRTNYTNNNEVEYAFQFKVGYIF